MQQDIWQTLENKNVTLNFWSLVETLQFVKSKLVEKKLAEASMKSNHIRIPFWIFGYYYDCNYKLLLVTLNFLLNGCLYSLCKFAWITVVKWVSNFFYLWKGCLIQMKLQNFILGLVFARYIYIYIYRWNSFLELFFWKWVVQTWWNVKAVFHFKTLWTSTTWSHCLLIPSFECNTSKSKSDM